MTCRRPSLKTSSMAARVVVADRGEDALADALRRARRSAPSPSIRASARSASAAGPAGHEPVEDDGGPGQVLLLDRLGAACTRTCRSGAFAEDDDQAGEPVADRDEVDPPDVGGPGLGRGRERRPSGWRRRGRRREAEPLLAGVLDLAELVADHQLLDRRQLARVRDRLDEVAVAGVGRDRGRRDVWGWVSRPADLELGEDVPDGRARHAEAVALDERGRPDRGRVSDVFLDDGPEDRLGSGIQRAGGADAARHGLASWCVVLGVSTHGWRVLTNLSSPGRGVSTLRGPFCHRRRVYDRTSRGRI